METTCRFCSGGLDYECETCGLVCAGCIEGCAFWGHDFDLFAEG